MAIRDFFTGLGQRVGRGLTAVGGYDPMQQVSPEEAARRRQEGLSALQRSLGRSAAILSGDPRRMELAEQQMQMAEQEKKQKELNKKLDDAIDKSNLPQSQKNLLKSLNVQTKAQTLMQTFEPVKEDLTTDQKNYRLAVQQGYQGSFMDYMKEKKAPLVTIDQGQKVFEQEAAKAGFKTQQEAAKTVEGYSDIENRLDILAKQLEGADPVQTGVIEEIKIPFKKIAAGLNILPQAELDKLSQQELFQATTNYIIPRMRVAGSGSTSDREIELFKSSVPNLGNTVAGNKTLVGGLQAIAKYNKKRLFEMDKYLKDNGNLLGFGEFADAKLGPVYETYISDDDFDKKVREGKLKKGDFVYDALSGQFRVLSEEDIKGAM